MENVEELIQHIDTNLWEFNSDIVYKIKDICLKNYNYKPRFNEVNVIIHEWQHKTNNTILTLDVVRQFICNDLFELMSGLQHKYLSDSQQLKSFFHKGLVEARDNRHEIYQRKIKKVAEICLFLRKDLFIIFVDNYRNGYLN